MSKFGKWAVLVVYGGLCALEAAIIIKNSTRRDYEHAKDLDETSRVYDDIISSIKNDISDHKPNHYSNMMQAICDSDMFGYQKEHVLSAMPKPSKLSEGTCDAIVYICRSDMFGYQKEQAILKRINKEVMK